MKQANKQTSKLIGTMLALGALAIPAQAATIVAGTQIGIAPGSTLTDTVGNDWNDLATTDTTYNTIHDLNGDTLTGVSVQFAGGGINDAGENDWVGLSTEGGSAPSEFVDSVTTDLWFNNGTITITGLNTALTYDIYSVNHGGGSGFDAVEDTHSVTGDVSYGSSTLSRGDSRLNGVFHTFLGVSPDNTGQIVFTVTQPSGSNGAVNGILINAVPEPSTTALLGLGGLALILRRRK